MEIIKPLDVFNKNKIELSKTHEQLILDIKNKAEELDNLIVCFHAPREMALARTKLEECVMWATKGIANWCKEYPGGVNRELVSQDE
jgi:hypothetical protein